MQEGAIVAEILLNFDLVFFDFEVGKAVSSPLIGESGGLFSDDDGDVLPCSGSGVVGEGHSHNILPNILTDLLVFDLFVILY